MRAKALNNRFFSLMPIRLSKIEKAYAEHKFGGFTQYDGVVRFCTRVQALLKSNDVVVDVGCGRGKRVDDPCEFRRNLQYLGGHGRKVIGIDLNQDASVNPFIDEFRLIDQDRNWPIDDYSVDLVYCDYVLEHVTDPKPFFREIHRILKPGGYLCLRTPNAWSYVAIFSILIPNRWHGRVTRYTQKSRKSEDVFPTVYRCNTKGKILRELKRRGFDAAVLRIETEPGYLSFSQPIYRIGVCLHKILPPVMRTTLLVFAQKIAADAQIHGPTTPA